MQFDYSKLLGRIKEYRMTQDDLARAIEINPTTLSLKVNNRGFFSQIEIAKTCALLKIPTDEIGRYFFCPKS